MNNPQKRTPLYDAHLAVGGKMVDFSGFSMPVQYAGGILAEHRAVREDVGIFDVSHMGEVDFRGPGALPSIQRIVTNDASRLEDGRALYTAVCYPDGGIVDDCIVYRFTDAHYRIVINASNIEKDIAHFREHLAEDTEFQDRCDEFALIAVQGPRARELCAELGDPSLLEIPGFGLAEATVAGVAVVAARTGYTGEDGFELFVAADRARPVWDALAKGGATPAGLGARDTLRLEARLCLYGNDIDASTTPYEAGLGWVVKLDKGTDFVGMDALRRQKAAGVERKLVGFRLTDRGVVRPGAHVLGADDDVVGRVTSGGVAPTVGGSVGMAYVPREMSSPGTVLRLQQRGRELAAEIVKGPFYRRPS